MDGRTRLELIIFIQRWAVPRSIPGTATQREGVTPCAFKTHWGGVFSASAAPHTNSSSFTRFQVRMRGGKGLSLDWKTMVPSLESTTLGLLVQTQLQDLPAIFHSASPGFLWALG